MVHLLIINAARPRIYKTSCIIICITATLTQLYKLQCMMLQITFKTELNYSVSNTVSLETCF